jgi:hypothetical protein
LDSSKAGPIDLDLGIGQGRRSPQPGHLAEWERKAGDAWFQKS